MNKFLLITAAALALAGCNPPTGSTPTPVFTSGPFAGLTAQQLAAMACAGAQFTTAIVQADGTILKNQKVANGAATAQQLVAVNCQLLTVAPVAK